jgi:hypothetical protein
MLSVAYKGGGSLRDINNFEVQIPATPLSFPFVYHKPDAELCLSEEVIQDTLIDPSIYKV